MRRRSQKTDGLAKRFIWLRIGFFLVAGMITSRLFYWQVLAADKLQAIAEVQQTTTIEIPSSRGRILAEDGFPIVANQPAYLVYADLPKLEEKPEVMSEKLASLLAPSPEEMKATASAALVDELRLSTQQTLLNKFTTTRLAWVILKRSVAAEIKEAVEKLGFAGIGFEETSARFYPEASMAAQLTGFLGSDETGRSTGYFGLEGFYNLELTGRPGLVRQEIDALGRPITVGRFEDVSPRTGRDLRTYLNRGIQWLAEQKLEEALKKYGASSGEVVIMDPKTGGLVALASLPGYDQAFYQKFDSNLYRLPSIADTYEPGSTFKVIVMSAALEEGVVAPETTCDEPCRGRVVIGPYTIRTWNDEYHPGQTTAEILERSDNVGMVFVGQKLGKEKFVDYIRRFGFGEATNVDLDGEAVPKLRERWGDIDLATGSFGQGLAVTSLQMLRAVAALANGGKLMEPHVVKEVIGEEIQAVSPKVVRQVVSEKTARSITEMMVASVKSGEAQWTQLRGYRIAGKTGTAQIPIAGHYDEEKTIASFVGFAPADDPKFVMLVKLREPTISPWAAETAAPLWMEIAKELFFYLNIPPENNE
ncbi:hypothetical protein A3A66_01130 [Microgenomates group bacterium RIFCSPLOWO2_01_FULL_46_13]|nr:MAG: hypothetical protein A2783_01125 [Microgenomates group bacterium RIFCSPHIGHO2_01_FULL_45_11]OGV94607.1 MAG: hypothetical protein A3A66_01130 [Microgenomates group bacterium RIFCSPLOWO2_01_FULL_46_13]